MNRVNEKSITFKCKLRGIFVRKFRIFLKYIVIKFVDITLTNKVKITKNIKIAYGTTLLKLIFTGCSITK
jgi:hypothetical protein